MLASQVQGNANVIRISETKLDDTFHVDQFVLEGFSKPSELITTEMRVASLFAHEDIPARLISTEKALIECFFIELKVNQSLSIS